tara:strand:+ start:1236 stop:1382 length:147 start_codon:yes stop_codon:yes gene_type:complete
MDIQYKDDLIENFDIDETDELWGLQSRMNNCFNLNPNKNDIKKINIKH